MSQVIKCAEHGAGCNAELDSWGHHLESREKMAAIAAGHLAKRKAKLREWLCKQGGRQ